MAGVILVRTTCQRERQLGGVVCGMLIPQVRLPEMCQVAEPPFLSSLGCRELHTRVYASSFPSIELETCVAWADQAGGAGLRVRNFT